MKEVWKDVVGYEGIYKISSLGNVITLPKTTVTCGRKRGNKPRVFISNKGYFQLHLRKGGEIRLHHLHRIIAAAFIPNPNGKAIVHHKNTNRKDNSIKNLKWATYSENNSHAHTSGNQRLYYGEKHHQSKLNVTLVKEIRKKYKGGRHTITNLSLEYGVGRTTVFYLLKNKTWKNDQKRSQER